jgi:mannonate dehydratase
MKLADYLSPYPNIRWKFAKQVGIDYAVSKLPPAEDGLPPCSFEALLHLKTRFANAGLQLCAIEPAPPNEKIKLGLEGRDQEIEVFCELLRNMGAVGIPVLCYNFAAKISWYRTSTTIPSRGGALVTGYDHRLTEQAPLTDAGVVSEAKMWENYAYLMERIVPVAEAAGVRLALHPADPPVDSIRGISRLFYNLDSLKKAIDLFPSEYNGITFCQGTIASMGVNVPEAIKYFGGRNKIFLVHFRDVKGTPENFEETFNDDGQTDMAKAIRTYLEVGYDGYGRIDHVPTMAGEENNKPGYETLGMLFAAGYLKGLLEGVQSHDGES